MAKPSQGRLIHRFPFTLLLVIPVLIATGFVYFNAKAKSELSNRLWGDNKCSEGLDNKWSPVFVCVMTRFFSLTLAPLYGFAFNAVFLSFVAAVITVTSLDALQLSTSGRSNIVTRTPLVSWLLSHVASGAVVLPLLLFPAHAVPARGVADLRTHYQRLPNRAEVLAIPAAVGIGFIMPSVALQFWPDSVAVVVTWLLFPLLVSGLAPVARFALEPKPTAEEKEATAEQEVSANDLLAVYGPPSLASVLSHWLLIYATYRKNHYEYHLDEAADLSLGILYRDFWAMAVTMLYWLAIEAGFSTTLWTVLGGIVGGPGAGLCLGWIMRDYNMAMDAVLRASSGG